MRKHSSIFIFAFYTMIGCSSHQSFTKEEWDVLKIEAGNNWHVLNTFQGIYIQDRDLKDESVTISLDFTEKEQLEVLRVADSLNFWSMRDSDFLPKFITRKQESSGWVVPDPGYSFVHLKTKEKENRVKTEYFEVFPDPDNAKEIVEAKAKFARMNDVIYGILMKKKAYKNLPYGIWRL